jgi:hypothetical protein
VSISARNWAWDVEVYKTAAGERIKLKAGEKLTLTCLAELENAEEGCAYPTKVTIAKKTCQSIRTVDAHIESLVRMRAITKEKTRRSRDGRWLRNTYVLHVPDSYREKDPAWMRHNEYDT